MIVLKQIIILLIPVNFELVYDFYRWSIGKNDKPGSTLIRLLIVIPLISLLISKLGFNGFVETYVLELTFYFMIYDYLIGTLKHHDPLYKGQSKYDKIMSNLPPVLEFVLKAFFFAGGIAFYLHIEGNLFQMIYDKILKLIL